jgi:hypothetical protein
LMHISVVEVVSYGESTLADMAARLVSWPSLFLSYCVCDNAYFQGKT